MARAGDVVENPRRRESVRFLRVARDTAGRLLEMWVEAEPTGVAPPIHTHPRQEERFDVVAGEATCLIDGARRILRAGESAAIPPGAAHTWWASGPDRLVMRAELEPALRFETFLETIYGLQRSGRTNADGIPNPLQAAVLFDAFAGEWIPIFLPRRVRVLLPLLAAAGRAAGFRPWYPEFSPDGPVELSGPAPAART